MKKISILLAICISMLLSVNIYAYDVETVTNISGDNLEKVLLKELEGYGDVYADCEKEYGISSLFLISLSGIESGNGTSKIAHKYNNLFGWRCSSGWKKFNNYEESIRWCAYVISKNYIKKDGKYYKGTTVADVGKTYCPNSEEWITAIENRIKEMERILNE